MPTRSEDSFSSIISKNGEFPPMETIYINSSKGKSAALALLVFPLVAVILGTFIFFTYGVLTDGWGTKGQPAEAPIWGWPFLLLWGAMGLLILYRWWRYFIWELIDSRPRLTLDSQGITDKLLGVGCIEWDDINNVVLVIQGVGRNIDLHLSNRDTYVERMNAVAAWAYKIGHIFGDEKFRLYAANFDRPAGEVADLIVQCRNANIKRTV
jgi:hypothetical protein